MARVHGRLTAALLHASSAATMAWGYNAMTGSAFDAWIQTQKGGQLQFLTIQGLALAWVTTVLAFVHDVFPARQLKTLKRTLGMISMPLAFLISLIYWSLLLFYPDLIVPKFPIEPGPASSSSSELPPFRLGLDVDLALHALPAAGLFADFLLFERPYTRADMQWRAPALAGAMAVWYGSWVEYCATFNGVFPYPFLTESALPGRLAIYGGSTALAVVILWVLNGVHTQPLMGTVS
ncbi:hypothetical protein FA95DRAFT_1513312 [Auriscalpium vulgare]|uniref:Uncharacterized protein n=1 Tax=Auriscalpium vulgare TaxID=40419 RepID=A0ACB8S4U6_9AGAM|nr:hypothetical protein FA95DRAFT_1513312 [Auriscalpium vulgare]